MSDHARHMQIVSSRAAPGLSPRAPAPRYTPVRHVTRHAIQYRHAYNKTAARRRKNSIRLRTKQHDICRRFIIAACHSRHVARRHHLNPSNQPVPAFSITMSSGCRQRSLNDIHGHLSIFVHSTKCLLPNSHLQGGGGEEGRQVGWW